MNAYTIDMTDIVRKIGSCKGCDRRAELHNGVCIECLTDPRRGRKWAEMMHKCRTDPAYAVRIYERIQTDYGKKFFAMMFGDPTKEETISSNKPCVVIQLR